MAPPFPFLWFTLLPWLTSLVWGAGKLQITDITFDPNTVRPYTSVYISYVVLEDILPNFQNNAAVVVTVPSLMSIGDNVLSPPWYQFPGYDLNWTYYNTLYFPFLPPLQGRNVIMALISGTGPLPKGYESTFIIRDVYMEPDCRLPGLYSLNISNEIAYYRPADRQVYCPELDNFQLSFDDSTYDARDSMLVLQFVVDYFNMIVPAQDGVPTTVILEFPNGTLPDAFQLDSQSTLDISSFLDGSDVSYPWPKVGSALVTSPTIPGITMQPTIQQSFTPSKHTIVAGSIVTLTVTLINMPWNCTANQEFCVTIGYFRGCQKIPQAVTGCPEFTQLDVNLIPSYYGSLASTVRLSLFLGDPAYPLYIKSKYQVSVTFPTGQAYGIGGAQIKSIPRGGIIGASGSALINYDSNISFPSSNVLQFSLVGPSDYTVVPGQIYLTDYAVFEFGNISIPGTCSQAGSWTLQIGPWSIASPPEDEVTGCASISGLDLVFTPNYQGSIGVKGTFSFDVTGFPLPLEPLSITFPYYTGAGETFYVWSNVTTTPYFQVDGMANPPLTVYRNLSYTFMINSYYPFSLFTEGKVPYTRGVDSSTSGVLIWNVPSSDTPAYILYGNPDVPGMNGTIWILERPRGVQTTPATLISDDGFSRASQGIYADAFRQFTPGFWLARDRPRTTIQNISGRPVSYTYTAFRALSSSAEQVPMGRLNFQMWNLALPMDCTNIGPLTLSFGPWNVTMDPISDTIGCPTMSLLDIKFSTSVSNETSVVVTFVIQLTGAPLHPDTIKILFPPSDGFILGATTVIYRPFWDWVPDVHGPKLLTIPPVEVSITQGFDSGTPAPEGTQTNFTVSVYGVTMPRGCGSIGKFAVLVDDWRADGDVAGDRVLCPTLSGLDVKFTPVANQSARTNAILSFSVSDFLDPRWITVYPPARIDVSKARITSAFGWTLNPAGLRFAYANGQLAMVIDVIGGNRVPPGAYTITINDIKLPRANCSDLGDWTIQVGDSVTLTANPVSDVVESCVTLEDLEVIFSPDAEQGQIVNMTVFFTVEESPLQFIPGDSDWITIRPSVVSGIGFTLSSNLQDVMGGGWAPGLRLQTQNRAIFTQQFTKGTTIPVGTRTQLTVTNIQMPPKCDLPGIWEFSIGIWTVKEEPTNASSLVVCPEITNLEVVYTPNVPGSQAVEALVTFEVEVIRLRPQPGPLRFDFPGDSDIILWTYASLEGLGDWVPSSDVTIVPQTPGHRHGLVDGHTHPLHEVSLTQYFRGSPLEPGNYSFKLKGFALPANNCTELGLYKLTISNWSSPWTDPIFDSLFCQGLISSINVSMTPQRLPRMSEGATLKFDFVVPDCSFNELEVALPEHFVIPPQQVQNVVGLNLLGANQLVVEPTVFRIENIAATCYGTPVLPVERYRHVSFTLTGVKLGNSCDPGMYRISTRTCKLMDRSAGAAPLLRMCPPLPSDATGYYLSSAAMPSGCKLCDACQLEFQHPTLGPVFECYHGGIKFQRSNRSLAATCSDIEINKPMLW